MTLLRTFRPYAVAILSLSLLACGSSRGGYYLDDGPGDPDRIVVADAVPRAEPLHRFANRVYVVDGVEYSPATEVGGYVEEGLASWYGRRFQGRRTASGEPFDMYAMTAAHPTLPIPSYARVTALGSGKSVVVRINDRGPFHSTRLIDLSYAAAHKLGVTLKGTLRVRVESIDTSVAREEAAAATARDGDYLQVGAFSIEDRANKLATRVRTRLKLADNQVAVREGEGGMYRVWIGPFADERALGEVEGQLRERMGLESVRVHSVSQTGEVEQ